MNDRLQNLITVCLVTCAIVVVGLVIRRETMAEGPAEVVGPNVQPRPIANADVLAGTGHLLGPADARVRIVEFSDFQCPFCRTVQTSIRDVRQMFPGDVAVVYRHFPIEEIHPHAVAAAAAAECAGAQGLFEAYHDALYTEQDSIGTKSWDRFAVDAGVADIAEFKRCVDSGEMVARVERDQAAGRDAGIEVTPSFIINGVLIPGAIPTADLEQRVRDAL